LTEVVNLRDTGTIGEDTVRATLISQLRGLGLSRFEFDGDGLGVEEVRPFEDDAEGALADLPADAVVAADKVWRGGVVLGGHSCREIEGGVVKIMRLELTTD
jgi:hypothetical protein